MDKEIFVYVDIHGTSRLAGRLWTRTRKNRDSASFEYEKSWLTSQDRFSLDPMLTLDPGPFHTEVDKALFGAIGDSAPDRWGRMLMRRAERRRAKQTQQTPRTLHEADYLLMVYDEARQGALRFSETEGGPFLAADGAVRIPPLMELPRLLSAVQHLENDTETDEDLRLLLAPGSSLGGARPKASIRDRDGHLAIAKFPHKDDEIDAVRWEAVALSLAARAGLSVPAWRLEIVADRPVLLLRRFDREGAIRTPFLSAKSMLGARDNEPHSYLEIVDALRRHGASAHEDMRLLWRRIVFNILIANTDDHLRNHGFLYAGGDGWRLAPAYDLNPVPTDIKPRSLSTNVNADDGTGSTDLALEVAGYFELTSTEAHQIIADVQASVATWRQTATRLGLTPTEIDRMASAFLE